MDKKRPAHCSHPGVPAESGDRERERERERERSAPLTLSLSFARLCVMSASDRDNVSARSLAGRAAGVERK